MTRSLQHVKIWPGREYKTRAKGLGRTKFNYKKWKGGPSMLRIEDVGKIDHTGRTIVRNFYFISKCKEKSLEWPLARNWLPDLHFKKISSLQCGRDWRQTKMERTVVMCELRIASCITVYIFWFHLCLKKKMWDVFLNFLTFSGKNVFMYY